MGQSNLHRRIGYGVVRCIVSAIILTCLSSSFHAQSSLGKMATGPGSPAQRWSNRRAQTWFSKQPWPLGFNYIPSTAINSTEMWQKETFDRATIEREMHAAHLAGFNCARVFLQYLVWEHDPSGLKTRMRSFMEIATRNHIRVVWVFFDDCTFSTVIDPYLGKQPDVVPGEYANGWTPSPGEMRVLNEALWPGLKRYVTDLISTFRSDQRILAWDLYNEPGNSNMANKSLPLLKAVFTWARETVPSQPITSGVWSRSLADIDKFLLKNSDIITFHNYGDRGAMTREIDDLAQQGRPLICTEWLARQNGSTPSNMLPILHERHVGGMIWGLVNGKTQTNYHWGSKAGSAVPALWQHDVFRNDLSYYDPDEIALFQHYGFMNEK